LGYPNPLEIGRPAGAKVGRTAAGLETWAAGYIPQRVAVFWLGTQPGSSSTRLDPRFAAGLWHALIQFTAQDLPARDWPIPAGITTMQICDPSGQLPTPACPALVNEVFLNGNEPVSYDSLYRVYQINRETGRLATVFTPSGLIDEHVYMTVPPDARQWAAAAGIETPPEVYDTIQAPASSLDVQITDPAPFASVRGKVTLRGTAAGQNLAYFRLQAGAGLNPQSWLQIGPDTSTPVQAGKLAEWDTPGLNGLYALRLLVVRSDHSVENATIQVTVDNTPPVARVLYPLPGQSFSLPADRQITFQAEVSDAVGVQRAEWLVDGKLIGQNLVPPYSLTWQPTAGEHILVVRAFDPAGNLTTSADVKFTVK
jgi:membrane carboxypeptidase/penicillin-binding protein PbpC